MSSLWGGFVSAMRRNPARAMLVAGSLVAMQSVLWEYVRMRPDYRFIVEPWSLRGYELTQGIVVAVLSAGLLVLSVVAWKRFDRRIPNFGAMMAAAVLVVGVALAVVVSPEASDVNLNTLAALGVSFGAGLVIALVYRDLVARRVGGPAGYATIPILLVVGAILYLAVVKPLFVDDSQTLDLWVVVLILLGGLFIPAVLAPPAELAVNRVLILAAATTWMIQVLSAGAIRTTLLREQFELGGASAQYKDAQITSGMMLAFFGLLLALLGAIALWAKRRDELEALRRARQQRAAAQESMAELESQPVAS